jgi:hypothetical protein
MPSVAASRQYFQDPASFQSPRLPLLPSPFAQSSLFGDESTTEQLGSRSMLQSREEGHQEQIAYNLMPPIQSNPAVPEPLFNQLQHQQPPIPGLVGQHQFRQYPPSQLQQLQPYNVQLPNLGLDPYFDAGQKGSLSSEKCDFSPSLPPDNWNLLEPTPFAPGEDGTSSSTSLDTRMRLGSTNVNEAKDPDESRSRGKHGQRHRGHES